LSRIPKLTEQSPTSPADTEKGHSWSSRPSTGTASKDDEFESDDSDEEDTLHEESGSITKKSSGKSTTSGGSKGKRRSKKSSRIVVKDNPFGDLLICNPSNTFSAERPPLFAIEFQKLFVY
jgi:hypothetical protein